MSICINTGLWNIKMDTEAQISYLKGRYLPFPSLAEPESAGEERSLGLLAEGGPESRTFSAIFLRIKNIAISTKDGLLPFESWRNFLFFLPFEWLTFPPPFWHEGGESLVHKTLSFPGFASRFQLRRINPPPLSDFFIDFCERRRREGDSAREENRAGLWLTHVASSETVKLSQDLSSMIVSVFSAILGGEI